MALMTRHKVALCCGHPCGQKSLQGTQSSVLPDSDMCKLASYSISFKFHDDSLLDLSPYKIPNMVSHKAPFPCEEMRHHMAHLRWPGSASRGARREGALGHRASPGVARTVTWAP